MLACLEPWYLARFPGFSGSLLAIPDRLGYLRWLSRGDRSMQKYTMGIVIAAALLGLPRPPADAADVGAGQEPKSRRSVERMDFGKTPDGTPVELYVLSNGRITAKVMTYGGIITELLVPDRQGKTADVVLGFDTLDGLPGQEPAFRRDHRPGRQPDRQGVLHPRRPRIQAGREQRPEYLARRPEGVRQGRLEGRGRLGARRTGGQADLHEPRRRGGLPGQPLGRRHLYRDARRRAPDRLHRHDRQGHAGQPDESQLLQPGRPRLGDDPRPRADPGRRPVHPRRRDVDPDRRARAGPRHAAGLHVADGHRRPIWARSRRIRSDTTTTT